MPASYTISSVTLSSMPAGNQTVTISHKVEGQPDTSYVVDSANVQVQPNGVLVSPYTITGLAYNTSYRIRIANNCGGTAPATLLLTTGASPCPDILGITGTASNG